MADRVGAVHLVVAHQTRENRESGGVGARPGVRSARIRIEREDCPGAGLPSVQRRVPVRGVQLVQHTGIAVDHQQVPVAVRVRVIAGETAFDPLLLRLRLVWNWIPAVIALVVRFDERDVHLRLRAVGDDVRDPVDRRARVAAVTAEIRMHPARRTDERDERRALRIDRSAADVGVPPVVERKQRERRRKRAADRR